MRKFGKLLTMSETDIEDFQKLFTALQNSHTCTGMGIPMDQWPVASPTTIAKLEHLQQLWNTLSKEEKREIKNSCC